MRRFAAFGRERRGGLVPRPPSRGRAEQAFHRRGNGSALSRCSHGGRRLSNRSRPHTRKEHGAGDGGLSVWTAAPATAAATAANTAEFGKASGPRGSAADPQIRFVSLLAEGTPVLFGSRRHGRTTSEHALARQVIPGLCAGLLGWADRLFAGSSWWSQGRSAGADLLWRVGETFLLPPEKRRPAGSVLRSLDPSAQDRGRKRTAVKVGVIEYRLEGVVAAAPGYRRSTTILGREKARAEERAAFYHDRREMETAPDEWKTHRRGAGSSCEARCRSWFGRNATAC